MFHTYDWLYTTAGISETWFMKGQCRLYFLCREIQARQLMRLWLFPEPSRDSCVTKLSCGQFKIFHYKVSSFSKELTNTVLTFTTRPSPHQRGWQLYLLTSRFPSSNWLQRLHTSREPYGPYICDFSVYCIHFIEQRLFWRLWKASCNEVCRQLDQFSCSRWEHIRL